MDKAKKWLSQVNEPIESRREARDADAVALERHKLLFPDFPGCPVAFEKTLISEPQFEQKITLDELKLLDREQRVHVH